MKSRSLIAVVLAGIACCPIAWAQSSDFPPVITDIHISRTPFCAGPDWDSVTDRCLWELEPLYVCITVVDRDWNAGESDNNDEQALIITMNSYWVPYVRNQIVYGPEPPALGTDRNGVWERGGLYVWPPPPSGNETTVYLRWQTPTLNGRNQARLRGYIDYDALWTVLIGVANGTGEEKPGEDTVWSYAGFDVCALENPNFATGNPPPYADAGGDQFAVLAGSDVFLDASRSFDGTNIGFGPNATQIFDRDKLVYTWEWLDGPVRVDPVEDGDGKTETAQVRLEIPSPPDQPYIFRVVVSDGVNSVPSAAATRVHVRTVLPVNRAPLAAARGPAGAVAVGSTVELNASGSSDPDGDTLTYIWRQTNAIGQDLVAEDALKLFQPQNGSTSAVTKWRAMQKGTYYFRLLVRDEPAKRDAALTGQELSSIANLTVVVSGQAAGETLTATDTAATANGADTTAAEQSAPALLSAPSLCGAGLAPVALVPFGLLALRRRR